MYLKVFLSRTARFSCLKFGMQHCLVILTKLVQRVAPGSKMTPPQSGAGLNHRSTEENIKNVLPQNHLAHMHKIWYEILLRLANLYQVCSDGSPRVQNSSAARGFEFDYKIYSKVSYSSPPQVSKRVGPGALLCSALPSGSRGYIG